MRVWGKAPANLKDTTTVARAAVDGQPRQELLKQAVTSLLASGHADRVGVWLEPAGEAFGNSTQIMVFRGLVAEKEGDPVPAAWCKLSPQLPLPSELLTGLRSIQQEFSESPGHPMIGALVGMRRVLWTPVKTHGHLGGVVFAGSRNKKAYLNQALLESVAAELALAVELEDARSLNRHRREESRRVLAALVELESPSEALATIVNDCTQEDGRQNGPKPVSRPLVAMPICWREEAHRCGH